MRCLGSLSPLNAAWIHDYVLRAMCTKHIPPFRLWIVAPLILKGTGFWYPSAEYKAT